MKNARGERQLALLKSSKTRNIIESKTLRQPTPWISGQVYITER